MQAKIFTRCIPIQSKTLSWCGMNFHSRMCWNTCDEVFQLPMSDNAKGKASMYIQLFHPLLLSIILKLFLNYHRSVSPNCLGIFYELKLKYAPPNISVVSQGKSSFYLHFHFNATQHKCYQSFHIAQSLSKSQ